MTDRILTWLGGYALVAFIFGAAVLLLAVAGFAYGIVGFCLMFAALCVVIRYGFDRLFADSKPVEAYSAPEGGVLQ